MGFRPDGSGISAFNSLQEQEKEIFLVSSESRPALRPTQLRTQWVSGDKAAHHSPSFSAVVKNAWSYTSIPPYIFIAWWLIKFRDNFIVTRVQTYVIVKLYAPGMSRRF
jgi:hypothetical protein